MQDEITGAQILEFCESELFPETLQNSEAASSSNCCYEEHTSYPTPLSITTPPAGGPSSPSAAAGRRNNLAMLMDDQTVDDISASIDFTLSPSFSVPHDQQYSSNNQEAFAMPTMNNQIQLLGDASAAEAEGSLYAPHLYNPDQQQSMVAAPPFPTTGVKEDPSYNNIRLRSSSPACTLSDPMIGSYLSSSSVATPFSFDSSWLFFTGGGGGGSASGLLLGTDFSHQEMESQGDNGGFFLPDSLARVFNCSTGDLQVHRTRYIPYIFTRQTRYNCTSFYQCYTN